MLLFLWKPFGFVRIVILSLYNIISIYPKTTDQQNKVISYRVIWSCTDDLHPLLNIYIFIISYSKSQVYKHMISDCKLLEAFRERLI